MDFGLTGSQQEIKQVARKLLGTRAPWPEVRNAAERGSYSEALWWEMVGLGWPGIAVTEDHGGQGLGAVELAVLLEEAGYACSASPMLATATVAAVIQAAGSREQQRRWLPGLVSGDAVAHRCADMLLHTESTRSAAYYAAWAADAAPELLPEAAALAAAAAAGGGVEVTASAIQAHGGFGFTWEADVHWLYKRAQLDAALLGGARHHRAALARHGAARAAEPVRM